MNVSSTTRGLLTFSVEGLNPNEPILAMYQKLYATGKPDGDPFSRSLREQNEDTRIRSNDYKDSLPSGDYMLSVCPDAGGKASDDIKVTVK